MSPNERLFAAMGSVAHVVVVGGPPSLLDDAQQRIDRLEAAWSRFRADSEISRRNATLAAGGEPPQPSDDTRLLLDRAEEAFRITRGRFDPYRLDAVTN